jgi:uncharacterized protein DUF1800
MTTTWDRRRAAHLYLRAGFGARPDELDEALSLGREGTISRLVDYDAISTAELEAYLDLFAFDLDGYTDVPYDRFANLLRWWYLRMQYSPRPLEEKMTLFWHNHFATSINKVEAPQLMYAQNQIFRTLGMAHFADLLLAVSRDPAMLIWLDNASNIKDAPNENFAREVMELFTMGVNRYGQQDVTEGARAFTGWTIDPEHNNRFVFNPDFHDDGPKTFLFNRGFFKGEDIIAILAARPETASFITVKLARFFLGSDPSSALSQRLQNLFVSTAGNIREVVREILRSDDFDATAEAPDMIKSPAELVVHQRRVLGARDDPDNWTGWPEAMGQALFRPPNVGGWRGGQSWIHTGAYLLRINIGFSIMTQPPRVGDRLEWEISRFFEERAFGNADELIDFLLDRFNVVAPSASLRESLRSLFTGAGHPSTWDRGWYDYWGRMAAFLVMSSPEYQLQ